MSYSKSRSVISIFLSLYMAFMPTIKVYAEGTDDTQEIENIESIRLQGFETAKDAATAFQQNNTTFSGGTVTTQPFNGGNAISINVQDLYPDDNGNITNHTVTELEALGENPNDMISNGSSMQTKMFDDSQVNGSSIQGQAYDALLKTEEKGTPDLSNDPMLQASKEIFTNIDTIVKEFADCTTDTVFIQDEIVAHVPDIKRCERIHDKTTQCTVNHLISAVTDIKQVSGSFQLTHLDSSGGTEDCVANITMPGLGTFQVAAVFGKKFIGHPLNPLNAYDATEAVCHASWEILYKQHAASKGVDYETMSFNGSIISGSITATEVSSRVTGESWEPQSCIDEAKKLKGAMADGFATGSVECSVNMISKDGCTTVNGVLVCRDQMMTPPLDNIDKMCQEITVQADYGFYKGSLKCFIDAAGVEQCPVNEGGITDSCTKFEDDPTCGFIKSACVQGATGSVTGQCYVVEESWDCGTDVKIPTTKVEDTVTCAGPIRCMGDECLLTNRESSKDFAHVVATLNSLEFMARDLSCATDDAQNCQVFKGENLQCKKALGGAVDCCDVPTASGGVGNYIKLLMAANKLDTGIRAIEGESYIKDAYAALRLPTQQLWKNATKPFTSHLSGIKGTFDTQIDKVTGAVDAFIEPIDLVIEKTKKQLKQAIIDTIDTVYDSIQSAINSALGTGGTVGTTPTTPPIPGTPPVPVPAPVPGAGLATDALTGAAAESTGATIFSNVAAAANIIMIIYTVYNVSIMVAQMVYECEEPEFKLQTKKDVKSCHFVGSYCADEVLGACIEKRESYCCYNSPLARIIVSQANPSMGKPFGDPENPECGGISINDLSNLDWSNIDLSEWLGILQQNNLLENQVEITMDKITGPGSTFDLEGNRLNAVDRTIERFKGTDVDATRKNLGNTLDYKKGEK